MNKKAISTTATATAPAVTITAPAKRAADHVVLPQPSAVAEPPATETVADDSHCQRILRAGNGKGLIKFCRELAVIILRRYSIEDDAAQLRSRLHQSLMQTLQCSSQQAECLIDLALELIHSKVHGRYRRTELELSYLVATATGAVSDISAN